MSLWSTTRMRIHYLQHVDFEDLGTIADWAANNDWLKQQVRREIYITAFGLEEALQGTVLAAALSARQRDLGPIPRPARQAALRGQRYTETAVRRAMEQPDPRVALGKALRDIARELDVAGGDPADTTMRAISSTVDASTADPAIIAIRQPRGPPSRVPSPSTAVPFEMTATRLPRAVRFRASPGSAAISWQAIV